MKLPPSYWGYLYIKYSKTFGLNPRTVNYQQLQKAQKEPLGPLLHVILSSLILLCCLLQQLVSLPSLIKTLCLQLNCSKYQGFFPQYFKEFNPFWALLSLSFFHDFPCQAEYFLSCNISFIAESSLYYWQNVNLVLITCHARLHCLLMNFAINTHKPVPLQVPSESQSQRKENYHSSKAIFFLNSHCGINTSLQ